MNDNDEGMPWVVKSCGVLIGAIVLAGLYHNGCRSKSAAAPPKKPSLDEAARAALAEANSVRVVGLPLELRLEPGKWTKTWIKFPSVPYALEVSDAPAGVEITFSGGARATLYEEGHVDKDTGIVYTGRHDFNGLGTTIKAMAKEGGVLKIRRLAAKETTGAPWRRK